MYDFKSIYLAKSIPDAVLALSQNPKAVIISGGTDVLIGIREGKLKGCELISINGIEELKGVTMDGEDILISAASTFDFLENNPLVKRYIPLLAYASGQVGGPQIRAVGTIGGNICNGVTSADTATTLLVYNAKLQLISSKGSRIVPITQWYSAATPGISAGKTAREPDELLVSIRISKSDYEDFSGCYIKYAQRNAMDIATLGCAAAVKLNDAKDKIEHLRLAFGVAAPAPIRCYKTEDEAIDKPLTPELLERLAQLALSEISPRTSWRASKEFRLQIAYELTKRVIEKSITERGGVINAANN